MPPLLANAIQLLPLSFSANGYLDSGSPMRAYVKVPSNVGSVTSCLVTLAFRPFMAPATGSATDGGSTSGSGGSSTPTSGGGGNHSHVWAQWASNTPSGTATSQKHTDGAGSTNAFNLSAEGSGNNFATQTTSTHTHGVTIPAHTHSTPTHSHALAYGTFEETFPVSLSVKVKTYLRVGGAWVLQNTTASLTSDLQDVDLTAVVTGPGDWRFEVLSDAATPNGGRLGLDLFGTLELII